MSSKDAICNIFVVFHHNILSQVCPEQEWAKSSKKESDPDPTVMDPTFEYKYIWRDSYVNSTAGMIERAARIISII